LPGLLLTLAGMLALSLLLPGPFTLFGHAWDVHAMVLACLVTMVGYQVVMLGLFARFYSLTEHLDGERDRLLVALNRRFTLERGLLIGGIITVVGLAMDSFVFIRWLAVDMGPLNEVRPAIYATTLIALGMQTIFGAFFLSLLHIRKGQVS
jgi:hypothetical protein